MKATRIPLLAIAAAALVAYPARAPAGGFDDDPIVRAMRDELARSMQQLSLPSAPRPYFLSYSYWDADTIRVDASFGAIEHSSDVPRRAVAIDVRVGDYAADNSNTANARRFEIPLPLDDDYAELRRELWLGTDTAFKWATESFDRKQAVAAAETKDADDVGSFAKEAPTHLASELPPRGGAGADDQARLEALARKLSGVFRNNPDAYTANVSIYATRVRQLFVSSEGAAAAQPIRVVKVRIDCTTQAADGMPLHAGTSRWASTIDQLPPEAELVAAAEGLSRELSDLRKAPAVEDYAGPILVTGIAADQILRGLLVDALGGTPLPKSDRPGDRSSTDGPLIGKLGKRILPLGMSIVDDPAPTKLGGVAVLPAAKFDDEGIPLQKVSVVENGTLKRFLMSRTPRKGFEHSNGHGFANGAGPATAHAANLYVTSSHPVSDAELRRRAIAAATDEGNPYVIVIEKFAESGGGAVPVPEVMKKLYLDGHQELVRGGTIGTAITLRSLRDIVATGDKPTVMQYDDAAVTGTASIAAPGLLFRDGDVKKPTSSQRQPPITPRP